MTGGLRKVVWKHDGFWLSKDTLLEMLKDENGKIRDDVFFIGKKISGVFKGHANKGIAWFHKYNNFNSFQTEVEAIEEALDYLSDIEERSEDTERYDDLKLLEARFRILGGGL